MGEEMSLVARAEREFEDAERNVRRLNGDLEIAEAVLAIARVTLARAREQEREARGW